jgi:hypothetical protein
MAVWYTLWSFGIYLPFWFVWTEKNLATLSECADLPPEGLTKILFTEVAI